MIKTYNYYKSNYEALARNKDGIDITVPPLSKETEYRGLGTMEENIGPYIF